MKKIVLTGGGTAGHVSPNMALVPALSASGAELLYIGSYGGIEKELAADAGIPYCGISTGKLRRYFDWKNFTDPFRIIKGYFEARKALKVFRPEAVFSKGGFVAVPVVFAAKALKIPVIIHESDMTPGLANRLCFRATSKVLCNFPETLSCLPAGKSAVSGCPIRQELLCGSREKGLAFAGLSGEKPVLLVIGGSLGSQNVNRFLRQILPELLKELDVIHLCGKGNKDASLSLPGYVQYEYIKDELKDLFAAADIVISRAGANAICELKALRKPNLLIPLSGGASRGDQVLNAASFRKQGYSMVLEEEEITEEKLLAAVRELYGRREEFRAAMAGSEKESAIDTIVGLLEELCAK